MRISKRHIFLASILATAVVLLSGLPTSTPRPSRTAAAAAGPAKRVIRVYADPNNLPFSNRRQEGFENRLAEIIARELGAELQYNWQALRQGFFRRAFRDGDGDLIMGVPHGLERMLTSEPYYRSSYVFVWRRDRALAMASMDDPRLRSLKIGVPIVGGETSNTPPLVALSRRGIIRNTVGYTVYGDYEQDSPPARMVGAVAAGDVDVAILWGPLVGYFAKKQPVPLEIAPVTPQYDGHEEGHTPFAFDIAVGVDRRNPALRDEVNAVLARKRTEIRRILDEFGVPQVPVEQRNVQREHEQQALDND